MKQTYFTIIQFVIRILNSLLTAVRQCFTREGSEDHCSEDQNVVMKGGIAYDYESDRFLESQGDRAIKQSEGGRDASFKHRKRDRKRSVKSGQRTGD